MSGKVYACSVHQPGKPIPQEQLMRTYYWMVSWNLVDAAHTIQDLVNTQVMTRA